MGKIFAMQTCEHEFDSQNPHTKLGMVVATCLSSQCLEGRDSRSCYCPVSLVYLVSSKPLKHCLKNPKAQYQQLTSDSFPASMSTPDPTQFLPLPCTEISFSIGAHSIPRIHPIHKWRAVRMLGMVNLGEKEKRKNKDSKFPPPPH